ncbi:RNA polymerase sigma factor [Nonomuraea soli]|uniref:RNA polymerase sigma-70 factor (ECF subfamily) n=1 Tax=Nonomuraea soli TaxID=1032476 RepID=A0A7W0HSS4_9ACTN|nr:sigma-70 family RNA polymerase sigma factor [Nonomuraea soli]MBA2894324.1 RNA polymerase sigma-70 factor (ECF subfamily) [Nonomuraea soli]
MDHSHQRFTELYDRHYRDVLGYVLLRVADSQAAEDVVSETFLTTWRRLREVPDPALPWLLSAARNLVRKQHSSGLRGQALANRLAGLAPPPETDVAERIAQREAALAALAGLGEGDVEALVLASWYGLTPAEAARVAGCTARAFNVRLHRARRRLAQALDRAASTLEEQR